MSEIVNCQIVGTMLGFEDHGILSSMLSLKWPHAGCGFGGYAFDAYNEKTGKREGHVYGAWFIRRVLETVGVSKWEDLSGKYVRAETQGLGGRILRIGHITEDRWFNPEAEWTERAA